MDLIRQIAKELNIKVSQVEATIGLIDEGNTIPFISRYRKEVTGSLNDEILREFDERLRYLRNLEDKKVSILATIDEQGKLTDGLKKEIEAAMTLVELEDLYRPYRPKKRTRATIAKELGLEPLANLILLRKDNRPILQIAEKYVVEGVDNSQDALSKARDIIAEMISDRSEYRTHIRRRAFLSGIIVVKAKDENVDSVYENYYDYSEAAKSISGHRILAINRGEKEKFLSVKLEVDDESNISHMYRDMTIGDGNINMDEQILLAIQDAYKRLIFPAVEREVRNELTEMAENGAMGVFKSNLSQLLMAPPIASKNVLGWDPAFRTGCKLAVIDDTGHVLHTEVIFPTAPQNKVVEAKKRLKSIIKAYNIGLISLGNGTASRESEQIISEFIKEEKLNIAYAVVSEAGASVYSASKLASEEFPNFDVGQRSAVSIARRIQDPLAELVKIDPQAIGVGQYQHDMNQKRLREVLTGVVEDCVNRVGVDLNTASAALLEKVSGISKSVAKNIVEYREENGRFETRNKLLKVSKLGPKMYEQCAGFLRIAGGNEPLDNTSVHPENYKKAYTIISELGYKSEELTKGGLKGLANRVKSYKDLSVKLDIGTITLEDLIKELEKPSRDPREEMPKPILRSDVLDIKDITEGMILKGTVRNVIDFGAFVDIGVHDDGLVHISQLSDKYIKHPLEVVSVGDIVEVKVLSVDVKKRRIALTMKF